MMHYQKSDTGSDTKRDRFLYRQDVAHWLTGSGGGLGYHIRR